MTHRAARDGSLWALGLTKNTKSGRECLPALTRAAKTTPRGGCDFAEQVGCCLAGGMCAGALCPLLASEPLAGEGRGRFGRSLGPGPARTPLSRLGGACGMPSGVRSRRRRCTQKRATHHHQERVFRLDDDDDDELHNKFPHAVPLASARQHPENRKKNQAGHSSERAVEGQGGGGGGARGSNAPGGGGGGR